LSLTLQQLALALLRWVACRIASSVLPQAQAMLGRCPEPRRQESVQAREVGVVWRLGVRCERFGDEVALGVSTQRIPNEEEAGVGGEGKDPAPYGQRRGSCTTSWSTSTSGISANVSLVYKQELAGNQGPGAGVGTESVYVHHSRKVVLPYH
jgi:hypothetical protein